MQRWLHVRVCGYGELKAVFYGYVNVGSSVLWVCECWKQCSMAMWMLEAVFYGYVDVGSSTGVSAELKISTS